MSGARGLVRFDDWMSALTQRESTGAGDDATLDEIASEVRAALARLDEFEASVLERYYFMGRAPDEIARESGCSEQAVRRALREGAVKLRYALTDFVERRFELRTRQTETCPICASPQRVKAERIIAGKKSSETWRRIIRELRDALGIRVGTPQTLIGHTKYHSHAPKSSELNSTQRERKL